jgi:hypothetical protein
MVLRDWVPNHLLFQPLLPRQLSHAALGTAKRNDRNNMQHFQHIVFNLLLFMLITRFF